MKLSFEKDNGNILYLTGLYGRSIESQELQLQDDAEVKATLFSSDGVPSDDPFWPATLEPQGGGDYALAVPGRFFESIGGCRVYLEITLSDGTDASRTVAAEVSAPSRS